MAQFENYLPTPGMSGAEEIPRSKTLNLKAEPLCKVFFVPTEELSWQENFHAEKVMGKMGCVEYTIKHCIGQGVSRLLGLWVLGRATVERKGIFSLFSLCGLNRDTAKKE